MNSPATLLLAAALAVAAPGAPLLAASPASIELDLQVRCTVVFALVIGMQDHHSDRSERFPAMRQSGVLFMQSTIGRLEAERGIAMDKVEGYLMEQVKAIVPTLATAKDPGAALDAEMATCLPLLDQVAPGWQALSKP